MRNAILISICVVAWLHWLAAAAAASSSPPTCPNPNPKSRPWAISLRSQCPISFQPIPPVEVTDDFFEKALTSKWIKGHASLLFYASWCPFSKNAHLTFETLSSMYPQIEHIAVEQSLTMPSLFSRHGIHSLPAMLMVNQTTRVKFHGSKDLASLIKFYKQRTGLDPVQYITLDQSRSLETDGNSIMQSLLGSSLDGIWQREPYLIFSILFLFLRMVVYIFPRVLCRFKAIWASYRPHLNLEIFGETSQILGRIFHMIDVKGVLTKLKFCKCRDFQRGARNARVWASSLASVSLGETSASRFSS